MERANTVAVKIGVLGGSIQEFAMTSDNTVADLIERSGVDPTEKSVSVNNRTADVSMKLSDGDLVILQNKEVKGGRS